MRNRNFLLLLFCSISFAQFQTNSDEALMQAKRERKPLLISFYGIWCPPCNQLEEVVFESPNFLRSAKNFVLLKVDADAESSWTLKDKYKVGGYPTIIFATSTGKEIYRVVGFRNTRDFVRTMNWVYDNREKDLEKACQSSQSASLWHCGFTCAEKDDEACANKAFSVLEKKLKPNNLKLNFILTYRAKNMKEEVARKATYEELIKRLPKSPFAFLWANELVSFPAYDAGKLKPLLLPVLAEYPSVMKHPQLEVTGLAPTDVAQIRADILRKLGESEKAEAAWREAAEMLAELVTHLGKASAARGYTLERIGCLEEAGQEVEALKLSNEYRSKFPNEFTFHYRSARLLKELDRIVDAIGAGQEAHARAYGDNKIRTATLLMELYRVKGEKKLAKTLFDDMKTIVRPNSKLEVRTHRYWKALEDAYQKLLRSS